MDDRMELSAKERDSKEKFTQTENKGQVFMQGLTGGTSTGSVIAGQMTAETTDDEEDNIENLIRQKKEMFKESKGFRTLKGKLHENRIVVITGAPGEGKTTQAVQLCDLFIRTKQYKGVYYKTPGMVRSLGDENSITVLDNMFTEETFPLGGELRDIMTDIQKQVGATFDKPSFFIIVCQLFDLKKASDILESPLLRDEFVVNISDINCSEEDEDRCTERLDILNTRSTGLSRNDRAKIAQDKPFLMGFVGIFAYYGAIGQISRFSCSFYPHSFYASQIRTITEKDQKKTGFFMVLLFNGGKLDLSGPCNASMSRKIRAVNEVFKKLNWDILRKEAIYLMDTFLMCDNHGLVVFRYQVLYDACVAAISEQYPEVIWQHCRLKFLDSDRMDDTLQKNRETMNGAVEESSSLIKDNILMVTESNRKIMTDMVLERVRSRQFRDALRSIVLQSPNNIHELFGMLGKDFQYLITTTDINFGGNFLFWSAKSGNINLTVCVIKQPGVSTSDVESSVITCVQNDSTDAFKSLNTALKKAERKDIDFNINFTSNAKRTPLMLAAAIGHVNILTDLLEQGADPSMKDSNGQNCVHLAAASGNMKTFQILEEKLPLEVVSSIDNDGLTPNMVAHDSGNVHDNLPNLDTDEMIQLACMNNNVDELSKLLSRDGVNKDFRNSNGQTLVMRVAYYGHKKAFDLLVREGCDLLVINHDGYNLLHAACSGGNVYIVQYILSLSTFNINSKTSRGRTPVMEAAAEGHEKVFHLLLLHGCDLSGKDCNGCNILHVACAGGSVDIVQYILHQNIADRNSRDSHRRTPLQTAEECQHSALVKVLKGDPGELQHHGAIFASVAARDASKEIQNNWTDTLHCPSKVTTNLIVVSGFDILVTKDTLELYFENTRRSGGGEIKSARKRNDVAYITYKETGVAQNVVLREHTLGNRKLTVKLGETVQPRTIAVTGADPKQHLETIQLYFESKKKSGGGEVEDVKADRNVIYVRFKDEEDFQHVLKKKSHTIAGCKLTVVKADEESLEDGPDVSVEEDTKASPVIEIRGYPEDASDDSITLYFESKHISGGGDVELVSRNDKNGVILLKFENDEVAERVANRQHTLLGRKLLVKLSVQQVICKDKILLTGVPKLATEDLTNFLEGKTGHVVDSYLYGEEEGEILVSFAQSFEDFLKLSASVKKKPFLKTTLQVSVVAQTCSIAVRNVPDTVTEDHISLYFENFKRSGGGEVEDVFLNDSEKFAVVRFKDTSVAEAVCKRAHKLGKSTVDLSLHYECLGEFGGYAEPPCTKVPEPELFKDLEEYKLKFLVTNGSALERIKIEIEKIHGKLDMSLTNKLMMVTPAYTKDDKEAKSITKTWKDDVRKAVNEQLDAIEIEKTDVNSDMWPDVEPKMNEFRGMSDVHVFTEEHNWLIVVAGSKEKVRETGEKVKTVVKNVQAESDRKKNQTREKKSFVPGKLQVVLGKDIIPNTEYLKVNCDIKSGEVELVGQTEEVHNAVFTLYEAINKVSEQTITKFTSDQVELLRRPEVALCLEKNQKNQNWTAAGSWQVGKEGVIIYYDQDESDVFDAVLEFLMRSLSETTLQLDRDNVPLLTSPQFQKEVERLQWDRDNRVIITPQSQRRRIQITAVTEDMDYTKTAVENFIQGNTFCTEVLKYSQPVLKFMFLHCQDALDSISQDLKQFCVKFDCQGTDSSFSITLKATKPGIGQAQMSLKPIAEKVKCHQEVLKKVGINTFIESEDVLTQVEKNSRCIIRKTGDAADQATGQHRSSCNVTSQGYESVFTCTPDVNKLITVTVGDLVALASDVEAVVIEATCDLDPDSKQASAVIGRAGDKVKAEVKHHAKRSGSMLEGEVHGSSPGHLPCRVIILAVGPASTSNLDPGEIIKAVIMDSIKEAAKNNARSVALPSFSTIATRRYLSLDDCFRFILEGIDYFFDDNPGSILTKVFLCIEDTTQCQSLWNQSIKVFGENRVVAKQTEIRPKEEENPFSRRSRRRQGGKNRKPMNLSGAFNLAGDAIPAISEDDQGAEEEVPPPPPPAATADAPQLPTVVKPRILLVKTDMGFEEADVIVSSSNTSLDLNKGMVSRSLVGHAGPSIQAECRIKYPNGIQTDEIAVTKGGDMQCVEQIYHCVLPNWDVSTGKQALIDTLNNVLLKAHQTKWKTMAIPALGTGFLGYARDLVAQVMYETVTQFGKDHPDTTLNDVLFIVYPDDEESCQIFEAEYRKHIEAMGGKVASTQEEIDAEREQDLELYRVELKANKDRRGNPAAPTSQPAAEEGWFYEVGDWWSGKKLASATQAPDFNSLLRTSSSSDVTLWIYSDDYSNVQKAVDMIYRDMKSKVQTETIEEKTLKNWTTEQINELQKLEIQYDMTIKANKLLGRIAITGLLNNLSDARDHVYQMIREVKKDMQEKKYAKELKKVVQWYYIDTDEDTGDDKPTAYDADTNVKLERAFTKESKTQLAYGGYIFDFRKWVEYPEYDNSDEVKIMRKDIVVAASYKPPDSWEDTTDDITVKQVTKGTPEYLGVAKNLTDSFAGATLEIIRIDRVQNKTLHQQYQAKRQQMENQSSGVTIEKMLWHGTKQENGMNICNYGFNRSYCDKSQSTYGEGVYFTSTAPGAAQDLYAPVDAQGKRNLFQSKVLTGSFTKGQPSFRVPPGKDPSKPTLLYDSVVDDPANPTTFVIFSDTQAYPEYVITIKC